ncbi:hypothetical protein RRG08_049976 [Elysia crispata]|uniref:Uncharacterized protein n=1 Tax=Elysia crispata TaxID=231223 RepID=A0AAE1BB08_9GAST|nr:hypothetical protein RRG08_049976 [Elysia crispata]
MIDRMTDPVCPQQPSMFPVVVRAVGDTSLSLQVCEVECLLSPRHVGLGATERNVGHGAASWPACPVHKAQDKADDPRERPRVRQPLPSLEQLKDPRSREPGNLRMRDLGHSLKTRFSSVLKCHTQSDLGARRPVLVTSSVPKPALNFLGMVEQSICSPVFRFALGFEVTDQLINPQDFLLCLWTPAITDSHLWRIPNFNKIKSENQRYEPNTRSWRHPLNPSLSSLPILQDNRVAKTKANGSEDKWAEKDKPVYRCRARCLPDDWRQQQFSALPFVPVYLTSECKFLQPLGIHL